MEKIVKVATADVLLEGNLNIPDEATGIVLFAHGSGSSHLSPRNRFVAKVFNASGIATLLFDLLTLEEEESQDLRFNIPLLSERVIGAIDWVKNRNETKHLHIGLIGSSTGSASALVAAAARPKDVMAVVSRGGRPDLAQNALKNVVAPTLMIVGALDTDVIILNKQAMAEMDTDVSLKLVAQATHTFEEPGTLEYASELARDWFLRYLY